MRIGYAQSDEETETEVDCIDDNIEASAHLKYEVVHDENHTNVEVMLFVASLVKVEYCDESNQIFDGIEVICEVAPLAGQNAKDRLDDDD